MGSFFIAVGGSGQHVALALVDQIALAHHVYKRSLDPFEFLVLDRDIATGGGDTRKTAWQLTQEQLDALQRADFGAPASWQKSTEASSIRPSRDMDERTVEEVVSKAWGHVFFNPEQLKVEFRSGYFGQAPVAATLFGDVLKDERERKATAIRRLLVDPARRVVVAGSLVGGTGAGCLPRLVEFLGEDSGTKVAAVVMLQWYRLGGESGSFSDEAEARNDEMLSREPSALHYAAERLRRAATTVVLGHPRLKDSQRVRAWSGNTKQPAFEDLTLPHYAAAIAGSFLYAQQPTATSLYSVACPPIEAGLSLPREMTLFASDQARAPIDLGALVSRNLTFCERLYWAIQYLKHSPNTSFTYRRGVLRVPALDELLERCQHPKEHRTLLGSLEALLESKWRALQRLATSDRALVGTQLLETPAAQFAQVRGGLDTLRVWTRGRLGEGKDSRSLSSLLVEGLGDVELTNSKDSPERCLPQTTGGANDIGYSQARPGALSEMDQSAIEQIIRYEHIAAHSLPTTRTVEVLLEDAFNGRLKRNQDSPTAATDTMGKDVASWRRRWLYLWRGLCSGELTVKLPPPDDAKVRLADPLPEGVVVSTDKVIVGYISSRVAVVPAVVAGWERRLAAEAAGPPTQKLLGWIRLLERLGGGRDRLPKWLLWLAQWADGEQETTEIDAAVGFGGPKIKVLWPSQNADGGHQREIALPLPGPGPRDSLAFGELLVEFGVRVKKVGLNDLPRALKPLASCPLVTRFRVATGQKQRTIVVFRDKNAELNQLADLLELGVALLDEEGANRAVLTQGYRVEDSTFDDIAFVTRRQVLVDQVQPVGDVNDQFEPTRPDYPVRAEWADLIDSAALPRHVPNPTGATYHFQLKGLGAIEHAVRMLPKLDTTVLLWPKFRSALADPTPFRGYTALYDARSDKDRVVWFGNQKGQPNTIDWSIRLARSLRAQPLYTMHETDGLTTGGVPELFAVITEGHDDVGAGLFRAQLEPVGSIGAEQWGVDFGTSSSVVAVKSGAKAVVLAPAGELDQSKRYALDKPPSLESCRWYPTWHESAPRKGEPPSSLPSQLVLLTDTRPAEGELARAEALPYGQSLVLDHGGDLTAGWKEPWRTLTHLKWLEGDETRRLSTQEVATRRSIRRAYLVHLLQMAFCLRAGASSIGLIRGLPEQVETTFTLPLDMRESKIGDTSPAKMFAEDVTTALRLVSSVTGSAFTAKFIWESHAGAPPERNRNKLYVVADLGGGSLDLWGTDGTQEYADSYRFGGHDLIRQWAFDAHGGGEEREMELKRKLQTHPSVTIREERTNPRRIAIADGFFELATEAVVRWVSAVVLAAGKLGQRTIDVELSLLGMGWGLNEGFEVQPQRYVNHLEQQIKKFIASNGNSRDLAVAVHLGELPQGTTRKAFLAYNAVIHGGQGIVELLKHAPKAFLGTDLYLEHQDKASRFPWSECTDISVEQTARTRFLLHDSDTRAQPEPPLPRHKLDEASLQLILRAMKGRIASGTYTGRAPIALVMDKLRLHTLPDDSGTNHRV